MAELTEEAKSPECLFGIQSSPHSCNLEPTESSASASPLCPHCKSKRVWKDAHRYSVYGDKIQRWLCRDCALRFSDPEDIKNSWSKHEKEARSQLSNEIKMATDIVSSCQIGVKETKNLVAEQQIEVLRRNSTGDVKGKIIEYAWWLKKDGKSDSTILGRTKILRILTKRGANLYDPETIKDKIAKQPWSNGRKNNAVDAYTSFLKMVGGTWEAPVYQTIRKLPFIPKETEIDQLIAGSSKRMATYLQTIKETGARCGEIWRLKWDDIDFESKVINITPEKNSNPRVTHLSDKLLDMLRQLPKNYGENVFSYPQMRVDNHAVTFQQQRKRTAAKLSNPRIMKIHFHTLRHFKGTMLYHKTKDLLYVMQALGHKNIKNTLLYIQLEEALFQGEIDYISKVAKTPGEICALIEAGFEYVTEFEGLKFFRKRKT
jgi:integrase